MNHKTMFHIYTAFTAGVLAGYSTMAFGQVGNNFGVLNQNIATAEELSELSHISSSLAEDIINNRPFLTMEDFDNLLSESLDEDQRTDLFVHLFVPINLNAASEDEIMLVPGIGKRMQHEFEEYRPYSNLVQFRREIGKYVDDDEVARFEQYVFVPIDLNTGSEEDILSIPGMGRRMLHEFEEYRPYRNIAQFRREIGKYVDNNEVARLERYIVIK